MTRVAIGGAAWLAFGGVLAGSALGYASSAAQEAARRKHEERRAKELAAREDAIRFEARRFDAYVTMTTAANRFYGLAKYPVFARPAVPAPPDEADFGGHPTPLSDAYEQFMTTVGPAILLASTSETRDCIAALIRAVRRLFEAVNANAGTSSDGLELAFKGHRLAVRAAEAVMREEFGLARLRHYD